LAAGELWTQVKGPSAGALVGRRLYITDLGRDYWLSVGRARGIQYVNDVVCDGQFDSE
jgi:hypothetical protein